MRATLSRHDGAICHVGEIVNLSVGGVCVTADSVAAPVEGSCMVSFTLEGIGETVQIRAERVHAQQDRERCFGLRFIFPIHASAREVLERRISKFLFDVQRYERQRLKESKERA